MSAGSRVPAAAFDASEFARDILSRAGVPWTCSPSAKLSTDGTSAELASWNSMSRTNSRRQVISLAFQPDGGGGEVQGDPRLRPHRTNSALVT